MNTIKASDAVKLLRDSYKRKIKNYQKMALEASGQYETEKYVSKIDQFKAIIKELAYDEISGGYSKTAQSLTTEYLRSRGRNEKIEWGKVKTNGKVAKLSRQVDIVRKRYKRQLEGIDKELEGATGSRKDMLIDKREAISDMIKKLAYDRSKKSYPAFVVKEISRLEFQSRQKNRVGTARLQATGKKSLFYAVTKDLWYGKENGVSTDEKIINSLREMGIDVNNLNEAINEVSKISGIDFDRPYESANEWEKYKIREVIEAQLALAGFGLSRVS